MRTHIIYILLGIALLLTTSCQYKDFDEYAGTVNVKVVCDYSESGCDSVPAITRVVFYSTDSKGGPYVYDIKDSAVVSLPDGHFKVFAYNNDSEINRTRSFDNMTSAPVIYTDKADGRGIFKTDSLENAVYYDYPDKTYTDYIDADVIGNPYTSDTDDNRIVLSMHKVTRDVDIEVRGMRHTEYINSLRMSLDGMRREYSPVDSYNYNYVNLVADGHVINDSILHSSLNIFGASEQSHRLTLFIDGGNFHKVLSFDVSQQVNSQLLGTDTLKIIVHTDYDLKKDVPVNNGFDVDVDEWQDVEKPIDLDKEK